MPRHTSTTLHRAGALVAVGTLLFAACGGGSDDAAPSRRATTSTTTTTSSADPILSASWGDNTTIAIDGSSYRITSDGLPNHERQAQYALPDAGVMVPTADTATAGDDPTVAQSYDFTIPVEPTKAATPTSTSLGTIGIMISGAALFNPYEGDASTVATASNFTVKNAAGEDIAFLDTCNGHPTPMGQYHYHAIPVCITSVVDGATGPSHIIGIAFDGYTIYGNRDIDGNLITADQLDDCNGITSPTPEYPDGIYHYVLLDTPDSTSSIRCFTGEVDASLTTSAGGPPGGGGPGGPPPGGGALSASVTGTGGDTGAAPGSFVISCSLHRAAAAA